MSQHSYKKLQNELAELIASMPAESRLPSEPELARRMGVSRATLREAMRTFEGQGMLRRRQGVGTFVIGKVPVIDSGLEVLESIESLAKKIGLSVRVGEIKFEQINASEDEAAILNVPDGAPLTQVRRVIYTENSPIAYLIDTLPLDYLEPDDLRTNFSGSVLDLLLRRGDPKLAQSRTDIRAVGATPDVARALQIQRDDVLLRFEATLFSEDGRIIDHSISYFLPGYFHFHVVRRVG